MRWAPDAAALRRRLERLHGWHAWLWGFLALSGVLLYWPALRAPLAPVRVPLKMLHIGAGLAALVLLAGYGFHLGRHWRQLGPQWGKRLNVVIVVVLLCAWGLSGLVLTQERRLLGWTQWALAVHDLASWIGVPYLLGHVLLRWRKWRLPLPWASGRRQVAAVAVDDPLVAYHRRRQKSRRQFLIMWGRYGAVLGGALLTLGWLLDRKGLLREESPQAYPPPWPEGAVWPEPLRESSPPIGGGARGRFRYYNVTSRWPRFDPATWRLEVTGLVERPVSLRWEDVLRLPRRVFVRDFHCVSGWSVYRVTWEGIVLATLLDLVGPLPQATHAKFASFDNAYTDALTIGQARLEDVIVAILKDGQPLAPREGQPARLVVPAMFAYKSVKWLSRIELIDHPHVGFWEQLGYSTDAWLRSDHPRV
ncbi:MAG TPA: molybdopterin-dependent oxidoreductase [Limnochordia bacterium]